MAFLLAIISSLLFEVVNCDPNKRGGRRSAVKVFTEQGVAMISSVLTSEVAINVSIRIMDAFALKLSTLKLQVTR